MMLPELKIGSEGLSIAREKARAIFGENSFDIHVSRLICLPNLAYSSTLSCFISSRTDPSFSSSSLDSSSALAVAVSSISWACSRGRWKNESPILYLKNASASCVLFLKRFKACTGSSRLRRQARARSSGRRVPPFPSVRAVSSHFRLGAKTRGNVHSFRRAALVGRVRAGVGD